MTNKKIIFLVNCWPSGKYVNLLYMYSILGRGSFCCNYCLNAAWHGGDQFVVLLRWYGSPGFFDSGLQLICIFWSLVSHFPLDNTPYILDGVQVWWVCWSFNQLLVLLAVWAGATSCWKMKSASLKSWSAEGSIEVLKNFLVNGCTKNTMDQHQQMTLHPKSSQTVET